METSWRWQAVGQRRWRYQSRPFVLLLDMHKCQSDYNAEPAMCLSFCRMLHCPSPFPSSQPCPLAALKGAKKGQGSECYNALSWMGIQSFIRSLAAYTPIEHEDDDAQWSSDRNWASDPPPSLLKSLGPGTGPVLLGRHRRYVLMYAGALIDARLLFVWVQAENLSQIKANVLLVFRPGGKLCSPPCRAEFGCFLIYLGISKILSGHSCHRC